MSPELSPKCLPPASRQKGVGFGRGTRDGTIDLATDKPAPAMPACRHHEESATKLSWVRMSEVRTQNSSTA
jgi:hypothetical protein